MLLQPQSLAQHFVQGGPYGLVLLAGQRLDLVARGTQTGLESVGRVQQSGECLAMPAAAMPNPSADREGGQYHQEKRKRESGHVGGSNREAQSAVAGRRRQSPGNSYCDKAFGLTRPLPATNIPRLMSAEVPDALDAWRMVATRRSFDGRLPLAAMARLRDLLTDDQGEVRFSLDFDQDALQVPFVELRIDAELPLTCQRSLQRFLFPVAMVQRLGLIRGSSDTIDADEAALPLGYEALQVADDGYLRPADLVEDELILAIPLVPVDPDSEAVERDWPVQAEEQAQANPFAGLAALKKLP